MATPFLMAFLYLIPPSSTNPSPVLRLMVMPVSGRRKGRRKCCAQYQSTSKVGPARALVASYRPCSKWLLDALRWVHHPFRHAPLTSHDVCAVEGWTQEWKARRADMKSDERGVGSWEELEGGVG